MMYNVSDRLKEIGVKPELAEVYSNAIRLDNKEYTRNKLIEEQKKLNSLVSELYAADHKLKMTRLDLERKLGDIKRLHEDLEYYESNS